MKPVKKIPRINFLPPEMRPSLVNQQSFSILLLLTFFALPTIAGGLKLVTYKFRLDQAALIEKKSALSQELTILGDARAQSSEYKSLQAVKKALAERIFWAGVFKELSNVAPKTLWLTEFETKVEDSGKSVIISGHSRSQADIGEFLGNLEKSYFFRNIQMKFSKAEEGREPQQFRFQFEGTLFEPNSGGLNAKN